MFCDTKSATGALKQDIKPYDQPGAYLARTDSVEVSEKCHGPADIDRRSVDTSSEKLHNLVITDKMKKSESFRSQAEQRRQENLA